MQEPNKQLQERYCAADSCHLLCCFSAVCTVYCCCAMPTSPWGMNFSPAKQLQFVCKAHFKNQVPQHLFDRCKPHMSLEMQHDHRRATACGYRPQS